MSDEEGTIYMLCYAKPIGDPNRPRMSAQHYVGWFANPGRITHHKNGTSGVAIVYAFFRRGIPFVVSRTMPGTKSEERLVKQSGNHKRNCPNCNPNSGRKGRWR